MGLITKDSKCKKSYEMQDDCSCSMTEEAREKKIKCPKGQGFDDETLMCDTLPECWEDGTSEDCADGEYWNRMDCECQEKMKKVSKGDGEKSGKGGKSGKEGKSGKGGKSGKSGKRGE